MAAAVAAPVPIPAPATLPDLLNIENRNMYRLRPQDETEEVTWDLNDSQQASGEPTPSVQVRLKSLKSETEAFIIFNNTSSNRVRALWMDFKGNEVAYSIIEPGTKKKYRTFVTHPWIVREVTTGKRMMLNDSMVVVGHREEQVCEIANPPRLPWSTKTHCYYPPEFQASIRGLLLAYHHLATGQDDIIRPPAPKPAPASPATNLFSPKRQRLNSLPGTPLMSPKRATSLALLSPKLARSSAVPMAALAEVTTGPADAIRHTGTDRSSTMGFCKGLTSRLINLCISPFMPKTEPRTATPASAPAPAYEPEVMIQEDDLCVHLDNPSMTSSVASEPIRAVRFDDSDEEAEQQRADAEDLAAADVAVMSDVLDVLTVQRSKSVTPLHLGSLHFDLVWQILEAAVPDTVFQDIGLPKGARPDIQPAHLPEDPIKFEQQQAAAAAAAAQQAAQAAQAAGQQAQQNGQQ